MLETVIIKEPLKMETLTRCDLCGSSNLVFWDTARSNTLNQCALCGLICTNPRIADSKVKDKVIYSEAYFRQKSRMTPKLVAARAKTYELEIKTLEKLAPGGKILDVGCGMGVFLECFGSQWEKYGCDVSSFALEKARKRKITVFHGEFEDLNFGEKIFDVVYFRASLHHTYHPKRCIQKARQLLKPTGVLAVCMSNNASGPAGMLFKAHVRSYEQAHNYLFSKKTLTRYLEFNGFRIDHITYPYFGTGYTTWKDMVMFFPLYIKYLGLKFSGKIDLQEYNDFSSPPFYGNYINIYARL
jgi:ubiquinone/menaquinone biosynthesis C-methylase UbiE